ncbi:hypothetical protein PUW92_03365, partial [Metamycoplasma hyosynoviae]
MFFIVVWVICITSSFAISIVVFSKIGYSHKVLEENLTYFYNKKYKLDINFAKSFYSTKNGLIFSYVIASIATIIFFVGFFIKYDEKYNVVSFIFAEKIFMILVLIYTWSLIVSMHKLKFKNYKLYQKYFKEQDDSWEPYFLPLSSLNIEDKKFLMVKK